MAITFPEKAKNNFQLADSVNKTITLILPVDRAHCPIPSDSIRAVYTWGTVSEFKDSVSSCRVTDFSEDSCYYKVYSYSEIARPGDSGQPEFGFEVVVDDTTDYLFTPDKDGPTACDTALLCYSSYNLVMALLPGGPDYMTTDRNELLSRQNEAREIRPIIDYDLTDSIDQHRISNFRPVSGTCGLYRSYHPYYPTQRKMDSEAERVHWAGELGQQAGVRSVLCLTSDLSRYADSTYVCDSVEYVISIPEYYRAAMDSGHVAYVGASATQCYFHTGEARFAGYMRDVVQFIADTVHPLPMQVHCAIGADRTGVICAVISVLCGASWQDIQENYRATSDMKVRTYRHPNRIRYALQQLTGLNPDHSTIPQLAAAIRYHLVDEMQVLTNAEIDAMVSRLTEGVHTGISSVNIFVDTPCKVYDLLGRKVESTTPGVQIHIDAQGWCTKQVVRP